MIRLEDVLKTSSEDVRLRQTYSSWSRRLQDVFWRRKTSSRRLHQDECFLGDDQLTKGYHNNMLPLAVIWNNQMAFWWSPWITWQVRDLGTRALVNKQYVSVLSGLALLPNLCKSWYVTFIIVDHHQVPWQSNHLSPMLQANSLTMAVSNEFHQTYWSIKLYGP